MKEEADEKCIHLEYGEEHTGVVRLLCPGRRLLNWVWISCGVNWRP